MQKACRTRYGMGLAAIISLTTCIAQTDAPLPAGVKAVWELEKAFREKTATRERVCLNGLWRWQPATKGQNAVPPGTWGYFKVPGFWPGFNTCYQSDSQTVFAHPAWKAENLAGIGAAWYQREIKVPADWTGRKISVWADCVNSKALVFVDGNKTGEVLFARGEVDLTAACPPGSTHMLSILVRAVPLKEVMSTFGQSSQEEKTKVTVQRRGLCGDVYLVGERANARVSDVKVDTSVRKGEIAFHTALLGLEADAQYTLRATISDNGKSVKEFTNKPFKGGDLAEGRISFTEAWKADKLWNVHTPKNTYQLELSLLDASGKIIDTFLPVRVGFREFWIEGRDFFLNGSRIHLRSVALDSAQMGAAWASYEGAIESLTRLKNFGINFVYTHNNVASPGEHIGFGEILRAADDLGMLVAFTQPHFAEFDWKAADAETTNGCSAYVDLHVRIAQNHPSVVCYVMNHGAASPSEDMNPDKIDGIYTEPTPWSANNLKMAARTEAIVKHFDPTRVIYYHHSGNIGSTYTSNFYPNWTPIQELSDWFEHWATVGVKPVFTVEYAAPFSLDWLMYRGWFKGTRAWNSTGCMEFCLAEWGAQFSGDHAFKISNAEKENLRFEGKKIAAGQEWYRWDYPHEADSGVFNEEMSPVTALYLAENWRSYRTWGVSAISPWEHNLFWTAKAGMDKRKDLKVDWDNLQRPGFSADFTQGGRHERMELSFERADWVDTPAAQAMYRNNMPILAYIGGKPARFTSKDHNFYSGESVEKQLIIINDARETISCDCTWSLGLPQAVTGNKKVSVKAGEQERIPLRFDLTTGGAPGRYELTATVKIDNGETQKDSFSINVLATAKPPPSDKKIAIFDPKGETTKLLSGMGVKGQSVNANADLAAFDTLIVGKAALTLEGSAPDISRVRDGLKVVLFEQTSEVLEKRFGFRVEEYGLRNVFKRVPDHPILAGLNLENLHDWRGEATIMPAQLDCPLSMKLSGAPAIKWCGIEIPHIWRAGCRGNVASVLIEKPARGDFLPLLDGGYSLQYSPLMEYHDGKGLVLFCQMDVTGRTESDAAADTLTRNLLTYVAAWKPSPIRQVLYVGDDAGKSHLEKTGVPVGLYDGGNLAADQVLVIGPGGGAKLSAGAANIATWLKAGGNLLAIGLDEADANACLPFKVSMKKAEHIAAFFEPSGMKSLVAGVGSADVHNRSPREMPLVTGGATVIGDGVLAKAENANVVFCQMVPWQFTYKIPQNTKRTFRRSSCMVTRILGNMGVTGATPILDRFKCPVTTAKPEKRWLNGLYLDQPDEWDNPYRFFRW